MYIITTLDPVRGDSKFSANNDHELMAYFEAILMDWSSVVRIIVEKKD